MMRFLNVRSGLTTAAMLSLIAFIAGGCASPGASRDVSLASWQANVEKYVKDTGKGDPTVLRDATLADGRKGYAMLGNPIVKDSRDGVGLLLGAPRLNGKPSFVYLLGMVDKGKVNDLRLAVLTIDNGRFEWAVGPSNPPAVQAYLRYRDAQWKQRSPSRKDVPLEAEEFPGPDDTFALAVEGSRVTATHQPTGTTWAVDASTAKAHGQVARVE